MSQSVIRRAAAFLATLTAVIAGSGVAHAEPALMNGVYHLSANYTQQTVNGAPSPASPAELFFAMQSGCGLNAGCTGIGVIMADLENRATFQAPVPFGFTLDANTATWVGTSRFEKDCGSGGYVHVNWTLTFQLQADGIFRGYTIEDKPPFCGGLLQAPIEAYLAGPLPPGLSFDDAS